MSRKSDKSTQAQEHGIVLIGNEFWDIIFKKTDKIRRPIPVTWQKVIENTGEFPDWFSKHYYKKGTILFMREGYRPERKENGDIYRFNEDRETFVPQQNGKYRKIRWRSAFSMKKADSRLFLRVVRFRINPKSLTMTITVEIDRLRSKPHFWPTKSQVQKLLKNRQ